MSTVVYSAQRSGFEPGVVYRNPKYFEAPLGAPDLVIVVGDWPRVVEAYEALGVRVHRIRPGQPLRFPGELPPPPVAPPPGPGAPPVRSAETDERDPRTDSGRRVVIPANWRDLRYIAPANELSLRSLAASVSPTPIRNKTEAVAAIEAYLAGTPA